MAAKSLLMQAHTWDSGRNISGWWYSEKMDGVRAVLVGAGVASRYGNIFPAPDWWLDRVRAGSGGERLDGELMHQGGRQELLKVVKKVGSPWWKEVCFCVFDIVGSGMFRERYDRLVRLNDGWPTTGDLRLVPCVPLGDQRPADVAARFNEGIVLRDPDALYTCERVWSVLKVKNTSDMEGVIVGYNPGNGKYTGMLGSYMVRCNGRKGECLINVSGMTDADRAAPLAVGTVITFTHRGFTDDGLPAEARYHSVYAGL